MLRRHLAVAGIALGWPTVMVAVSCGLDSRGTLAEAPLPPRADAEADAPDLPPPADAAFDQRADADAGSPCPVGLPGPALVLVGDAGFCIDATEVTNSDYDKFLVATGTTPDGGLPTPCASLVSFARKNGPPDGGPPDVPVSRVTWCDAFAYCKWAGKRLCRRPDADRDAAAGEWYAACSNGGAQRYPYGPSYVDGACWDNNAAFSARPVASKPGCEGPPGVFDMTGNVLEWIESCFEPYDQCAAVGGAYSSPSPDPSSDIASCRHTYDYYRTTADPVIGIRCCVEAH